MALIYIVGPLETLGGLVLLALLSGFLYFNHRRRLTWRRRANDPTIWTGSGIDVTRLRPTVQQLRQDYGAPHPRAKITRYHDALLGLARHAVSRLPYFRDRETEQPAHR
jgi:hypothetical protein